MSYIITPIGTPIGTAFITDSDANATAQKNVAGAAAIIHAIEIDNTNNASVPVYFKIYDAANPTVGTAVPDMKLKIPMGGKLVMQMSEGYETSTAISYCCTTETATSGVTGPSRDVPVVMLVEV
jgi:hypothetical protein